ncbi:unnamed protein product [Dovyalis caffra]|uniref:Uncharacterized protein n=1 Tax=Dovyalis caffra TaxID=77055 RepID=A0AAV1R9V8_9ROSI|nr:unnamed protein product [Dovyalis caffra]
MKRQIGKTGASVPDRDLLAVIGSDSDGDQGNQHQEVELDAYDENKSLQKFGTDQEGYRLDYYEIEDPDDEDWNGDVEEVEAEEHKEEIEAEDHKVESEVDGLKIQIQDAYLMLPRYFPRMDSYEE